VTRSLEIVSGQHYIVARVVSENGERIGGNAGLPVHLVSATEFRATSGGLSTYRVQPDGTLLGFHPGEREPFMRAKPHSGLWAR
jgi:hypothetical protein